MAPALSAPAWPRTVGRVKIPPCPAPRRHRRACFPRPSCRGRGPGHGHRGLRRGLPASRLAELHPRGQRVRRHALESPARARRRAPDARGAADDSRGARRRRRVRVPRARRAGAPRGHPARGGRAHPRATPRRRRWLSGPAGPRLPLASRGDLVRLLAGSRRRHAPDRRALHRHAHRRRLRAAGPRAAGAPAVLDRRLRRDRRHAAGDPLPARCGAPEPPARGASPGRDLDAARGHHPRPLVRAARAAHGAVQVLLPPLPARGVGRHAPRARRARRSPSASSRRPSRSRSTGRTTRASWCSSCRRR